VFYADYRARSFHLSSNNAPRVIPVSFYETVKSTPRSTSDRDRPIEPESNDPEKKCIHHDCVRWCRLTHSGNRDVKKLFMSSVRRYALQSEAAAATIKADGL
jgi:hypothetical protein